MTDPQVENGYTRIANELFEAIIRHPFTLRQQTVVFAVIRKTYGYHKTSDVISWNQLSEMTNIDRAHCGRTINQLIDMGVLIATQTPLGTRLKLSKNYREWGGAKRAPGGAKRAPPKKSARGCQKSTSSGAKRAPVGGAELAPTKERYKDNSKDISSSVSKDTSEEGTQPKKITKKNSEKNPKPTPREKARPEGWYEVANYLIEYGYDHDDASHEADKFYNHFEANGWRTGRNPLKDWKAAARNWMTRAHEFKPRR